MKTFTTSNKIVSVPTETILGSQSRSRIAHLNSINEPHETKKNDSDKTLQTIEQNTSHQTLNKVTSAHPSPSAQLLANAAAFTRMPV
jgi:predicted house-cleaning NTP pyrophosphatase (Maf/HAM1 superfamily)